MIVPSMNSEEILKEIFLDLRIVENKADYLSKSLRREAIKSKSKAVTKCWDYKSPRKNDWVILFKSTPSYCGISTSVHYLNKMGFNCLLISQEGTTHHYSGHFLLRYNQRFLKQDHLSKLELFKNFISHNTLSTIEVMNPGEDEIKRIIIKLKDGIAFGTLENINGHKIYDYRTFISNDMVLAFQKEDINYINNNYEAFCNENPVLKKMEIL